MTLVVAGLLVVGVAAGLGGVYAQATASNPFEVKARVLNRVLPMDGQSRPRWFEKLVVRFSNPLDDFGEIERTDGQLVLVSYAVDPPAHPEPECELISYTVKDASGGDLSKLVNRMLEQNPSVSTDEVAQAAVVGTVTVYPVNVVKGENVDRDKTLAPTVASFLAKQGLATPTLGDRDFTYAFQWGANQAAMAKRSARASAAQVKADTITTDYALLVEVLMWRDGTTVGGVEFYLCDKAGNLADGSLRNSDWDDFQKINPTTPEGGVEMARGMLKQAWGQQKK